MTNLIRRSLYSAVTLLVLISSQQVFAQGGMGNMPREDVILLSATVRDSLSDEIFARVLDLKRFAETNQPDSAALLIAHNGGATKEGRWSRAVNMANLEEKTRVAQLMTKLAGLVKQFPQLHQEHYAVFKNKENPAGQQHLYQINFVNGPRKRMVSLTFYPVGDRMLLGDIQ
jgi:hypothetical protein